MSKTIRRTEIEAAIKANKLGEYEDEVIEELKRLWYLLDRVSNWREAEGSESRILARWGVFDAHNYYSEKK